MILLFNMAHKYNSVSKYKKAGMFLMEKICVLYKICLGISYSAIGHEFSVKKSTS